MEYQKLAFSPKSDFLVAVSSIPDFTLYLYDILEEKLLCKKQV